QSKPMPRGRGQKKAGKCTQAGTALQSGLLGRRVARRRPRAKGLAQLKCPYNRGHTYMESGRLLDSAIVALDRGLRSVFAPARASGAATALLGDRASLGFVAETERQVEGHLDDHLGRLPPADTRSRAILEAMRGEEIAHGAAAAAAGGTQLPAPVRALMRYTARVMTGAAYWV